MRSSLLSMLFVTSAAMLLLESRANAQEPPAAPPVAPASTPVATPDPTAPTSAPPAATSPVTAPLLAAEPPPPLAPIGAAPADGTVEVHVSSPRVVSLERRAAPGAPWEHVCDSPCDARSTIGLEHRIVGLDINASRPFTLGAGAENGKVTLTVRPGMHDKEMIGKGVAVAGGVITLAGLIVVIAGSASANGNTFAPDGLTHNGNTDFISAGTLMIVGGIATLITGGGFAIDAAHSKVDADVVTPSGRDAAKMDPSHAGSLVRESWAPAAFSLPIFRGTF